MKKVIVGSLLLGMLMLGSHVNAEESSVLNEESSQLETTMTDREDELNKALEAEYKSEQFEAIMSIPELEDVSDASADSKSSVSATMNNEQQRVVNEAKKQLGKPYVWGGKGPNSFDCSGLVQYVYKNAVNLNVPAPTTTQETLGKEVSLSNIQPGDLLFYGSRGSTYHVGIYIGNNQMIHAPQPGQNVKTTDIQYFYPQFARRILNSSTEFKVSNIDYTTRIKGQGWTTESRNGATSGTTGKNIALEGLCVAIKDGNTSGSVQYRAHVTDKGWLGWVSNGRIAGGYGERLEAIQIKLTGDMSNMYNVVYRTHVQDIGWTSWVRNGATSGTTGQNKQVEAVQIKLIKK